MILTSGFWLRLLNTPEEIFNETRGYLIVYLIGFIFNYLLTVIMESLRAIGNSKAPLVFVGISTTINLILDPILIKLGLGVIGAGIATAISMCIGMLIAIIYV
ncbi:MAG: polysaccharide biosynthesis C-terminal domain-containing protein, partial [Clostridia bacterium]|nr:polysaccharide biosynthesis C-terminal domain-containing protein [Clostridia bacterium]